MMCGTIPVLSLGLPCVLLIYNHKEAELFKLILIISIMTIIIVIIILINVIIDINHRSMKITDYWFRFILFVASSGLAN